MYLDYFESGGIFRDLFLLAVDWTYKENGWSLQKINTEVEDTIKKLFKYGEAHLNMSAALNMSGRKGPGLE